MVFTAKLRNTKWFKTHSADVRNAILQKTADPATYAANVSKMQTTVNDTWGKTFGADTRNNAQLKKWAEMAVRMGWSEDQLIDHMGSSINYQKLLASKNLGGTAAETEAAVLALEAVQKALDGKRPKKVIVVPQRIVNVVA